jgi:hypothetical protein
VLPRMETGSGAVRPVASGTCLSCLSGQGVVSAPEVLSSMATRISHSVARRPPAPPRSADSFLSRDACVVRARIPDRPVQSRGRSRRRS